MPTREDVDLARAAIDRGFLTMQESVECLRIQHEHEAKGQVVPLDYVFLETKIMTPQQVAVIKESLARAAALRNIGPYEIICKVGAGGMGTVYKAKDQKADRIVALKVLSPSHVSNKEYIQRFLREAKASGRLSHPNIVQGFDAGEANGQYYFAMEFVDGFPCTEMLKEGRPIPEQQVLDIAIQIAKSLQHAEENNLVHRDIKPDNIMMMKDGTAKLADLGLARLINDSSFREQRAFGTAYYASPEQIEGVEELDSKSDQYSFGATIFHMLAGRVPFDGQSAEQIIQKHIDERPPYLKDINVQISHGISKVVRKLMSKQKKERYDSFSEVVKDLSLVRMARSPRLGEKRYDTAEYRVKSETGSWRTIPEKPKVRKPVLWICVGSAALAVIIGTYFLVRGSDTPPPTPAEPRPPVVARQAHEILLGSLIKKFNWNDTDKSCANRDKFYEELLKFKQAYPNTDSATKAEKIAADIFSQMITEVEPLYKVTADAAKKLADEKKYQAALDKIKEFPADQYPQLPFTAQTEKFAKEVAARADADYTKIKADFQRLKSEKKFDEAAAVLKPAIETFGIPAYKAEAEREIQQMNSAKNVEDRRKQQEQARLEAERRRREAEEQARKAVAEEYAATRRKYTNSFALIEGADAFTRLAEKLTAEDKAMLTVIAADFREADANIKLVREQAEKLKGKSITIKKTNGQEISGKVMNVTAKHVTLEGDGGKMMSSTWDDMSFESYLSLLVTIRGEHTVAQRLAFATFYAAFLKKEAATAEITRTRLPADEERVKMHLKIIDFFAQN